MKKLSIAFYFTFIMTILIFSCGKDNYDAPSSTLKGKITYNGNPVGVRGSNNSVRLQLWQSNYPLKTPIDVFVSQDGSFSSKLFDGEYQLITVPGNGPWMHKEDTLSVHVQGDTNIDFPVEIYYEMKSINYQINGSTLTATLQVDQIDQSKEVQEVNLLINNTKFVDQGYHIKQSKITEIQDGLVTISMDIGPELEKNTIIFARVALKIAGITEAIYDPNPFQVK